MDRPFDGWEVTAVNLAEHARNPIHTDAGARAQGFPGALVAGVSVYAYLTHLPAAAWGAAWVGGGGAEVRFGQPVFAGDRLRCAATGDGSGGAIPIAGSVAGSVRATARVWTDARPPSDPRPGEGLQPLETELGPERADAGRRLGDDLALYDDGLVHPETWLDLANSIVHRQLARGSWIHTRSVVRHHSTATVGEIAHLDAVVVDRFDTRSGERAILDVAVSVDGRPVATIEHEALVALTRSG